jgi:acyl-CoA synthetase (AMP-forming)/AMP-acid ligase II
LNVTTTAVPDRGDRGGLGVIELLRAATAYAPDHPAVITPTRRLTYRELTAAAQAAAGALQRRGIDRLAVLDADPATVWTLLAAGSLAGTEVCVYPPAASDDEVARFRAKFGHDAVVSARPLPGDAVLAPAELTGDPVTAAPPSRRPVLILTSGTSGPAKGARHDWGRLLRMADGVRPTPHQRWLLAYGPNQFGGFQILLHVAAARATLVAGTSFRPRDGLAAMRRHGVTHASGTPTFWRFLLAELRADGDAPPPLRQITLSGEAVPGPLLDQLRARFPGARLSQIFGATEMGRTITVRDGRPGLPAAFLDAPGDVSFRIVDGELHVRSTAAMLGYHGEESSALEWRATGDLVEVVGDRIHFRGRRTEVINVGGVKVHPLPIEERVGGVPGVAVAQAFGRPNPLVGQIVALEVVPDADAEEDALRERIRAACADLPAAARPRSVSFVPVLTTTGNKLARGGRG